MKTIDLIRWFIEITAWVLIPGGSVIYYLDGPIVGILLIFLMLINNRKR